MLVFYLHQSLIFKREIFGKTINFNSLANDIKIIRSRAVAGRARVPGDDAGNVIGFPAVKTQTPGQIYIFLIKKETLVKILAKIVRIFDLITILGVRRSSANSRAKAGLGHLCLFKRLPPINRQSAINAKNLFLFVKLPDILPALSAG